MEYYSAIKKDWSNAMCSNMDATRDDHTKWSQSDKDKYHYHLYVESIKQDTDEPICETKTDSGTREQACGCQGEEGGGRVGLEVYD